MLRAYRLSKSEDFAALRKSGRSWSNKLLVLVIRPNGRETSRVGFVVGKRVGNAVVRNKIKRRLRETVRLRRIEGGWDLILIARKGAPKVAFQEISSSVDSLFHRAGFHASPW